MGTPDAVNITIEGDVQEPPTPAPEPTITVLVTLPDRASLERISQRLEGWEVVRFRVVGAGRLEEALRILDGGGVDAVLLGLRLPDASGLSCVQRVRQRAPRVPVVAVIAAQDLALGPAAVREGAAEFLLEDEADHRLLRHRLLLAVERHRMADGLREREERLALALDGSNDGLWDWDLERGVVLYSARWNGLVGEPERECTAGPEHWFERVHPEDLPGLRGVLGAHIDGASRRFECEHRLRGGGGDHLWVVARGQVVRDLQGRAHRVVGTLREITARKQTEQQLLYRALHDPLTGMANRALFLDRVEVGLANLRRQSSAHFAVLFVDLDDFKHVNDSHGHGVGDLLLAGVAHRLRPVLRPGDTLARLGGDEFGVLLGNVAEPTAAVRVAERVQDLLGQPFIVEGHEIAVTASIGIALSTTGYGSPDQIVHDADLAMYRAKSVGTGAFSLFDPELHRSAVTERELESELHRAVERGQFIMHYQPVVALAEGRVAGFEGLVRWDHPRRGVLGPTEFLPSAERTALIVPIGWWALAAACRQGREWQRSAGGKRPLWISVNISDTLLMQVDMVGRLRSILSDADLEPEHLRLELAEQAIVSHGDTALKRLNELRELGVRLTVDDFGLGYASLNYLQLFQYDSLKIRPSYINHLESISRSLVRTVLVLANDLGIEVVAEGVETAEQARRLQELRCPYAQGFWFSRPVAVPAATQILGSPPRWWKTE